MSAANISLLNVDNKNISKPPKFADKLNVAELNKPKWSSDLITNLKTAIENYYDNNDQHLGHKMTLEDIIRYGIKNEKFDKDEDIHELNIHKTETTDDLKWMAIGSLVISPIIFLINYLINKLVNLAWKKALFIFIMVICVNFAIYKVYTLKIKDFDVEKGVIITFLVVYQINLFDDLYSEFQKEDLKTELTKMRLNATSGFAVGGEVKGYEGKEHKETEESKEHETDALLETTESDTQSEF
tara:strand:- start:10614 stop:11339 length:726 start_codon:yes stop_codon:yes gene_type:complete